MKLALQAPWRRIGTWLATASLVCSTLVHAESTDCAPPQYANLPIVDTGLPVVQIWTTGLAPVRDRENYLDACMRITEGSVMRYGTGLYHGTLKIRGRGHSSWGMPKKGYRLKLSAASPVLDMPAHKDWVLLANYADKTLLRNAIGFDLSRRVGMAWTPRMRFADVYLNNDFLGNYQIGEKIEVAPTRVAITPMSTSDVEGGYLLEVDYKERIAADDVEFVTHKSNDEPWGSDDVPGAGQARHFVMQEPSGSDVQEKQMAYISDYVQKLQDAIFAADPDPNTGIASRLHIDSMVNYYLVQELLKNKDSAMGSSVYLYKDRGGKLTMGPLWDFDISAGNINYDPRAEEPEGWYLRNATPWFKALMRVPDFKARVVARWPGFRRSIEYLDTYIEEQAYLLEASQQENFARWPILKTYVWPNQVVKGSYKDEVKWLQKWLKDRIKWMDKHIEE